MAKKKRKRTPRKPLKRRIIADSIGRDLPLFARRIRAIRKRLGISQDELARRAGQFKQNISNLERGHRLNPSVATLSALAKALGVDLDALVR